ncbi:hypothetical protein BKI52_36680 [marine bacterium AO1-C]|nr:hypothetical protein BKI52_36680 [marine bacterium AO1-C]
MRHIFLLGIALTLSYGVSQAQYAFRVLASSGQSKIAGKTKKLYVGTTLQSSNKVTVSPRSYLSLVHKSGGTVQISKAGTYSVSSLEQKLAKTKASASKRYATYIISELTKNGKENINRNRYKYMNVTGSVKRETTFNKFKVFLASTSNFFNPQVEVKWNPLAMTKKYRVTLVDEFGEEVFSQETADTTVAINFKDIKSESAMFIFNVSSKERANIKSEPYQIGPIEVEKAPAFKKEYDAFKKTISGKMNAADKLTEAFIFEKHEFYVDAMKSYKAAVEMSGGDEAYDTAFRQFMIRHGIGDYEKYLQDNKK